MPSLLIMKRFELHMDLVLYKIKLLLYYYRIRTKKRPNTTIRDRSHVNMGSDCLVLRHSFDLNGLLATMVAGLRRVLYWVQLFKIVCLSTRACKKDVATHGISTVYQIFSPRTHSDVHEVVRFNLSYRIHCDISVILY